MPSAQPRRILVTNDDGIDAPGIRVLAKAMGALGEVWVVAPEKTQNAVGRAMTLHKPLRLRQMRTRWFAVNGTPADCVTLAVCKLLETTVPALVVSGINKGWNLGDDVTNSGTVAGALEGMLHGIPSMAVSLEDCPRASHSRCPLCGTTGGADSEIWFARRDDSQCERPWLEKRDYRRFAVHQFEPTSVP